MKLQSINSSDLFYLLPIKAWCVDAEGYVVQANKAFLSFLGKEEMVIEGKHISEVLAKEDAEWEEDLNARVVFDEREVDENVWITNFRGEKVEVHIHKTLIEASEPGKKCILTYATEISETKTENIGNEKFEQLYSSLLEFSSDAIMLLAPPDWKFVAGNPEIVKMFGVRNEKEFCKLTPWMISPEFQPDGRPSAEKAREMIQQAVEKGRHAFDWVHKRINGNPFPCKVLLIRTDFEKHFLIQAIVQDVSMQRDTEVARADVEKRLASLSDNLPDGYIYQVLLDRHTNSRTFMYLGAGIERIHHLSREDVLKNSGLLYSQLLREDVERVLGMEEEAIKEQKAFKAEARFLLPDGTIKHLMLTSNPRPQTDGVMWDGFVFDITERKLAEQALEKSEEKFRVMAETSSDVIWHLDENFCFTYISPSDYRIRGFSKKEVLRKPLWVFLSPESIQHVKEMNALRLEDERRGIITSTIRYELEMLCKGGHYIWAEITVTPHRSKEGKLTGYHGVARDITDRKKAEDALRKSEARLKLSLKVNNASLFENNFVTGHAENSPELFQFFGYEPDEIPNSVDGLTRIIHQDDLPQVMEALDKHLKGEASYYYAEFRMLSKAGEWRWVEGRGQITEKDENGNPVVLLGISKDISERKRVETALRESEQRYRLIFEQAPLGVFQIDARGCITAYNKQFVDVLKTREGELLGLDITQLPDEKVVANVKKALSGSFISYEGDYTSVFTGKVTPVRFLLAPIINSLGEVDGAIGLIEDRSSVIEKEMLEAQVRIAEEAVKFKQNFLANMSHEIRTPLTGILGMMEMLERTPITEQQQEYLGILRNTSENLMEIINQVLDFSKIEAGKLQLKPIAFQLNDIIENARKLFHGVCKKGIEFYSNIDSSIPGNIKADKNRIVQVVNNLLANAVKFTERGQIGVEINMLEEDDRISGPDIFEGNKDLIKIKVLVSDTGIGISEDKQSNLFLPFSQVDQRDVRKYEGTGLGLSICKQLVALHGGEIGVVSKPGMGSVFWFSFVAARVDEDDFAGESEAPALINPEISLQIMLAEDKKVNQKVIMLMLAELGHKVTLAENGRRVLELFKPGAFDLILMDIQMPLMDGITATRKLRAKYQTLPPIVGLSANAFEGDKEKYIGQGMDDYLTKPVRTEDFVKLINKLFC